jgi:hypothetical protein
MKPTYPNATTPNADDRALVKSIYRDHIWVASVYRDLLGRRFDDEGLNTHVQHLISGFGMLRVATEFVYSWENCTIMTNGLYEKFLNRLPEMGEANDWITNFRRGESYQGILATFLTRGEYIAKNPIPTDFAKAFYRYQLDREPTATELEDALALVWNPNLPEPGPPPQNATELFVVKFVLKLLSSQEFALKFAHEQFEKFLRRSPQAGAEIEFWVDMVMKGSPLQFFCLRLLNSEEYVTVAEGLW